MAALLNAGNNALNQIYDLEIDRVNKPKRPLPSGRLTIAQALVVHAASPTRWRWCSRGSVAPGGRHECFWLVAVAVVCTYIYSVPPLAHQAARHLGQRDDRDSARRAAEGRRLVVGEDDRRRRAVVHRRDLRPVPARRDDDEGFRGHGGRPARRLPHAADSVRRAARGVDDLAVVRRPVHDDSASAPGRAS
mgnify:CR=1 FL=1